MSSSFSFAEWYRLNGKRLNKKRKARYHTDSRYRQKVLDTNQDCRERRKSTADPRDKVARVRPEHRWKTITGEVNGRTEILFTIGALAEVLHCSIQAVRLWERQGLIPKTPIRAGNKNKGDRLYTREMVDRIRTVLAAQGKLSLEVKTESEGSEPRPLKRWVRLKKSRRPRKKKVVQVKLWLIGVLAKAVKRNVATLEQLEQRGILPETPFRASSIGRRLYTEKMIKTVCRAFEKRGGEIHGEEAWELFHAEVLRGWTAQGVMGAVILEAAPRKKRVIVDGSITKKDQSETFSEAAEAVATRH
jgi:DNA-binding transcriptional MerR regulator